MFGVKYQTPRELARYILLHDEKVV